MSQLQLAMEIAAISEAAILDCLRVLLRSMRAFGPSWTFLALIVTLTELTDVKKRRLIQLPSPE